jgi:cellulose 1,4-beta-cellobiosidase
LERWSSATGELNYAQELVRAAKGMLKGWEAHVIIDTSRNGDLTGHMQRDEGCANWCNIRGAGAGLLPTADTANSSMIDAYFWLKTPGESDGCTRWLPDGQTCRRFDGMCTSEASIGTRDGEPRAPEAGDWFDYQFQELARNADFSPRSSHSAPSLMRVPVGTELPHEIHGSFRSHPGLVAV